MKTTTNGIVEQILARIRGARPGPRMADTATDALVRIVSEHLEQEHAVESAERTRLAREYAELHAEEAVAGPERYAKVAGAMKRLETSMEAARAVEREYNATRLQAFGESLEANRRLARLESELRATADERIAAFIDELDGRRIDTWRSIQVTRYRNRLTDDLRVFDNRASVEAAVAAIAVARSAAEALQLEALDEASVTARLAALRASIPNVESSRADEDTRAADMWVRA